jgi:GNAT superfamily N-acetyltransferase
MIQLYLTSSERGRKLGEFLLKYAINFAGKNNFKSIRLETTSKFKEAVSLYQKHGFTLLKGVEKAPGHDLAFEKSIKFYHQP